MDKIIPSFCESLFDGSSDTIKDLCEFGIDSILDDGVFKEFPIVNLLIGIKNTAQNIHDRNLLKQTLEKEDKETKFLFDFKNNILNLHDKTLNRDINIKLLIKCLQILKNDIIISYQIEEEIFDFLISYTEE